MVTVQALYELQELEGALQKSKADLSEVASRLDHNEGVVRARERAVRAKQAGHALVDLEARRLQGDGLAIVLGELAGFEEWLHAGDSTRRPASPLGPCHRAAARPTS